MNIEKLRKYSYLFISIFIILIFFTTLTYIKLVKKNQAGKDIFFNLNKNNFPSKHIRNGFSLDPNSLRKRKKISQIISNEISKLKSNPNIHSISVYYTDLSTMMRVSINTGIKYVPASLLKLPLMISGLKVAETSPTVFANSYTFTNDFAENITPSITGSKSLEIGKKYSYDEILKYAIVYSDNRAALFLRHLLMTYNMEIYNELFTDLDMESPDQLEKNNIEFKISASVFANFFRILYNCNYLNPQHSEYALNMLISVEYKNGLAKYLPKEIEIAHKFGAFKKGTNFELHDCGIVYASGNPYILSVMSDGRNFDDLSDAVGKISKAVYDEVNK